MDGWSMVHLHLAYDSRPLRLQMRDGKQALAYMANDYLLCFWALVFKLPV